MTVPATQRQLLLLLLALVASTVGAAPLGQQSHEQHERDAVSPYQGPFDGTTPGYRAGDGNWTLPTVRSPFAIDARGHPAYGGCWNANGKSWTPESWTYDMRMTTARCLALCTENYHQVDGGVTRGYKHAVLQAGTRCACTDNFPATATLQNDLYCANELPLGGAMVIRGVPVAGNLDEPLGGNLNETSGLETKSWTNSALVRFDVAKLFSQSGAARGKQTDDPSMLPGAVVKVTYPDFDPTGAGKPTVTFLQAVDACERRNTPDSEGSWGICTLGDLARYAHYKPAEGSGSAAADGWTSTPGPDTTDATTRYLLGGFAKGSAFASATGRLPWDAQAAAHGWCCETFSNTFRLSKQPGSLTYAQADTQCSSFGAHVCSLSELNGAAATVVPVVQDCSMMWTSTDACASATTAGCDAKYVAMLYSRHVADELVGPNCPLTSSKAAFYLRDSGANVMAAARPVAQNRFNAMCCRDAPSDTLFKDITNMPTAAFEPFSVDNGDDACYRALSERITQGYHSELRRVYSNFGQSARWARALNLVSRQQTGACADEATFARVRDTLGDELDMVSVVDAFYRTSLAYETDMEKLQTEALTRAHATLQYSQDFPIKTSNDRKKKWKIFKKVLTTALKVGLSVAGGLAAEASLFSATHMAQMGLGSALGKSTKELRASAKSMQKTLKTMSSVTDAAFKAASIANDAHAKYNEVFYPVNNGFSSESGTAPNQALDLDFDSYLAQAADTFAQDMAAMVSLLVNVTADPNKLTWLRRMHSLRFEADGQNMHLQQFTDLIELQASFELQAYQQLLPSKYQLVSRVEINYAKNDKDHGKCSLNTDALTNKWTSNAWRFGMPGCRYDQGAATVWLSENGQAKTDDPKMPGPPVFARLHWIDGQVGEHSLDCVHRRASFAVNVRANALGADTCAWNSQASSWKNPADVTFEDGDWAFNHSQLKWCAKK